MSLSSQPAPEQLWSAQQQQWLEALGHRLYLTGTPPAIAVPAAEVADPADAYAPPPQIAPARIAEPVSAPPVRAPRPAAATTAARGGSRLPDRLHFALIRASGCNPNAPESAAIIAGWPPSSALRGRPDAKRALWPTLRALRKQGRP